MQEQADYTTALLSEFNTKLRDIEEKQKLLKDRVLLIGENLVNAREGIEIEIAELKIHAEESKQEILKIKDSLQRLVDELENRARRAELETLKRQFKMFEPLKLARIEDVEKMIKERK